MREEIDGRGDLGRDATGQPRSRSLNLDDPGGPFGLPRPVHPAGAVENAKTAFPTAPWTAPTTRRPQAAQALLLFSFQEEA